MTGPAGTLSLDLSSFSGPPAIKIDDQIEMPDLRRGEAVSEQKKAPPW